MTKNILQQTGIYAIRNITNGKCYVGQAVNIKERWRHHYRELRSSKHHCNHLQRAFNKYGEDSFEKIVLELCDQSILTTREQHWMDSHKATGIYNTAQAAGSPLGIKRSKETKAKQSALKIGRKISEETKQKMREAQAKIKDLKSAKAKAQWANPIAIANISEKRKGRVTSEETKEKLRAGLKQRWSDPEYKAKMAVKMSGVRVEAAKVQSNTMKEKWADPEYRKYMMEAHANKKYN